LEKLAGWKGGSFLAHVLYPHGPSLTEKYTRDFNRVSNIDAYDSVRLCEVWLQQEWSDGRYSLRFGQLLADEEFFTADAADLFLNGAFGELPVASQARPAALWPVAAPGARFRWKASERFSFQTGVYSNVGDWDEGNKHGVDWRLGRYGVLVLAEAACNWKNGTLKLGAFYRNADEEALRHCAGGYVVVEQRLGQQLSVFARAGVAPNSRYTVPFYCDAGLNYKGLFPGREKDVAGCACGYTRVGGGETHHEATLEATYKAQINEWLSVQPDVQYIFNPGAVARAQNALVAGLRMKVEF